MLALRSHAAGSSTAHKQQVPARLTHCPTHLQALTHVGLRQEVHTAALHEQGLFVNSICQQACCFCDA